MTALQCLMCLVLNRDSPQARPEAPDEVDTMSATPKKPKCTPEQRAAISRANGACSHGPSTPEGLAASRRARFVHGCRAKVEIPETEPPDALEAAYQEW